VIQQPICYPALAFAAVTGQRGLIGVDENLVAEAQ
jgi:hypothetical protein